MTAASGTAFGDLRPEAAMAKAALLYADEVRLVSAKLPLLHVQSAEQMRSWRPLLDELGAAARDSPDVMSDLVAELRDRREPEAHQAAEMIASADDPVEALELIGAVWQEELLPRFRESPASTHVAQLVAFLPASASAFARRSGLPSEDLILAADDLQAAWKARLLSIELLHAERSFESEDLEPVVIEVLGALIDEIASIASRPGSSYPVFDDHAAGWLAAMAEGQVTSGPAGLAHGLIASLESFPMASMDVIFDVRERLQPATARFRSALLRANDEIISAGASAELGRLVEEVRLREVNPAIADIDETLEELGAKDTLLRGWPKVGAGTLGLAVAALLKAPELAQYVPIASGLSVAYIAEIAKRREIARDVRRRPLFFLHAADRYLKESVEDHSRR